MHDAKHSDQLSGTALPKLSGCPFVHRRRIGLLKCPGSGSTHPEPRRECARHCLRPIGLRTVFVLQEHALYLDFQE